MAADDVDPNELIGSPMRPIEAIKIGAKEKGYEKTEWSGIPMYVCTPCGADSFTEELVKSHVDQVHR
jgi:hypothetical protein